MKALDIAQVTFSYNPKEGKIKTAGAEYALRDFSMSVDSGQMHALLGPNGAGKTTLMPVSYTHLTLPTIYTV